MVFGIFFLVNSLVPITEESSFLDIGSGFGKCVFHALFAGFKKSTGIEYVRHRYEKSAKFFLDVSDLLPNYNRTSLFCTG
jgi:hypothetical protein